MIKYFSVENFASIANEIYFECDILKKGLESNKALVLFGTNASGKTNILKAITFLFWFIKDSFYSLKPDTKIPVETFLNTDTEVKFYTEFVVENELFKYTLHLTKEEVIYEKLEKKGFRKPIYEREKQDFIVLRDAKQDILKDLPKNASIISFLSRFESNIFAKKVYSFKFISNVKNTGFNEKIDEIKIAKEIIENNLKEKVIDILKIADTEIVDFEFEEIDFSEELLFYHKLEDGVFKLKFNQESEGTKRLFIKSLEILQIISSGGVYIVDEIDSNLHFMIVDYIIELFKNSKNSQIICAAHSPTIIQNFDKNTLWLLEKENGVTKLYSASDFKGLKKEFDLETLYKIGRLGAVSKCLKGKNG